MPLGGMISLLALALEEDQGSCIGQPIANGIARVGLALAHGATPYPSSAFVPIQRLAIRDEIIDLLPTEIAPPRR
jgi:hypothetical protein